MRCLACPDGHQLTSSRGEGPSPTVQCVVFFLADQAFPPTLGTLRGTCCTFVIRIEFGTIPELMHFFIRTTRGYLIPPGSQVVVSSASQLMAGGLAAYTRDLSEAADQVEGIFNGEVDLIPGPPILLGGTDSPVLIRSVLELARWAPGVRGAAGALKATFENVKTCIWEEHPATRCQASCTNMLLPAGLGSRFKLTPWRSYPMQPLLASCGQMSEATEARIPGGTAWCT